MWRGHSGFQESLLIVGGLGPFRVSRGLRWVSILFLVYRDARAHIGL